MINCENQDAMYQLENVLRAYLVRGLKPPSLPAETKADPAQSAEYSGWYEPVTPRNDSSQYLERFLGLTRLHFEITGCSPGTSPTASALTFESSVASIASSTMSPLIWRWSATGPTARFSSSAEATPSAVFLG
jgi:hypothetical protein